MASKEQEESCHGWQPLQYEVQSLLPLAVRKCRQLARHPTRIVRLDEHSRCRNVVRLPNPPKRCDRFHMLLKSLSTNPTACSLGAGNDGYFSCELAHD
jgi:hypothetical protein